MSTAVTIRPGRAADATAITRMYLEFGRFYLGLDADDFQLPDEDGLLEYVEADVETEPGAVCLVAELDGEPAGALWARIVEPRDDARFQINPNFGATQLYIDFLMTAEEHRRRGVGAALVAAAEQWGRERGATVALCDTYAASPLSVPFWHDGMGYRTRSLNLVKPLV